MSTRFYDTPGGDDTVRLLSNPFNNEALQADEFEVLESNKYNNPCSTCCSVPIIEANNASLGLIDNDHPVTVSLVTTTTTTTLAITPRQKQERLTREEAIPDVSPTKQLPASSVEQTQTAKVASGLSSDCHHCHKFLPPNFSTHSKSKLILALCLCLVFMIAEMIGGYIAGSVAVVSDGAHLLTDIVGFLISIIAISTSKKKCTKNFNLGFYRIEVLTTLSSILLIWIITAVFIYIAAVRLIDGDYKIKVDTMIIISSFGVIANIAMFLVLHGTCHPTHIHSHQIPLRETSKNNQNINVRAAIIHVVGDLVQSVGVFVSSIIMKFYPNAKFMDPVCTFLFSVIVVCSTLKLLKDSVCILMEGFPGNLEYNSILLSLQNIGGVRHVHSLGVWSLTLEKNILVVHLAVDESSDRDLILLQAQSIISTKFGISNHTIQIEKYQSKCVYSCQSCGSLWA